MNDDIRFILENALLAPSGDNTQPWHWMVHGNILELWSKLSDDTLHTLYSSSSNSGSSAYLGLGTAIENARIAASTRGYAVGIAYFPDPSQPTLTAVLTLTHDSQVQPDPLASALIKRMTNRKSYRRDPLSPEERAKILDASINAELGETQLIDDRSSISALAKVASLQDELMFSDRDLHDYVFSHINWTRKEDERKRVGFYFPTLGAPPFSWGAMQLLRCWWVARIGMFFKLHKIIAMEQRIIYRAAGAYGLVSARGNTPADWMRVGRLVERLWLAATSAGLSLHPLNGVILLNIGIETEAGKRAFTPEQRNRLKEAREKIARIFGVEGKTIAFMFRIGHGKPPSARTSRLPFEQMVEVINQPN